MPAQLRGWRAQLGYIDAAHRVHARVEDGIRTGKDCGIGGFPSRDFAINSAWLAVSLIAATLLSWLRLIALDGDLAKAEPKTLRYRVLHAAGKLVRGGRRRRLKIPATWPWAEAIATAWARITALPQAPCPAKSHPCDTEGVPPGPAEPPATGPPAGPPSYPDRKITNCSAAQPPSLASPPPA